LTSDTANQGFFLDCHFFDAYHPAIRILPRWVRLERLP
jgi:hypothetical protein